MTKRFLERERGREGASGCRSPGALPLCPAPLRCLESWQTGVTMTVTARLCLCVAGLPAAGRRRGVLGCESQLAEFGKGQIIYVRAGSWHV